MGHAPVYACETHPNDLVLRARSQVPPIRTEAHTPDIQIPFLRRLVVLQMADLLARRDIEDLRRAITARSHESPIMAEAHTAHHALVREIEHQLHVQTTRDARVEDGVPVLALALEVRRELLGV